MLDGYRRGEVTGGTIATLHPSLVGDETAIEMLARFVLSYMQREGYAHLSPPASFESGFVSGFQVARLRIATL